MCVGNEALRMDVAWHRGWSILGIEWMLKLLIRAVDIETGREGPRRQVMIHLHRGNLQSSWLLVLASGWRLEGDCGHDVCFV